ncbi:MAG TPA: hypothetical protein VFV19_07505 [Candidatus Polarisedimenticolaceae bacterium]|nr:hypothetical protein [Candidatus Polarisedimenticolaceae bacterium]
MKRSLTLALLVAGALAPAALAAPPDLLLLHDPFVLNGVLLAPGEYRFQMSRALDAIEILRDHRVLATAACKATAIVVPVTRDEVHSRTNAAGKEEIVRLVLAHARLDLDLSEPARTASAAVVLPRATEAR